VIDDRVIAVLPLTSWYTFSTSCLSIVMARNVGGTRSAKHRSVNSRPSPKDSHLPSSLSTSAISVRKKKDALIHNIQYAGQITIYLFIVSINLTLCNSPDTRRAQNGYGA
jgi:hypothetical protein